MCRFLSLCRAVLRAHIRYPRLGVPSRLVIFPDENHWVMNHGNRSVPVFDIHSTVIHLDLPQLEMALRSLPVVR